MGVCSLGSEDLAGSAKKLFLNVPSEERILRRTGVNLLRLSSWSSHGCKDSVSPSFPIIYLTGTWGVRDGLHGSAITGKQAT